MIKIVNGLSTQLGWTHFRYIIAFDDPLKRDFCAPSGFNNKPTLSGRKALFPAIDAKYLPGDIRSRIRD
jgi:hypothetical protein